MINCFGKSVCAVSLPAVVSLFTRPGTVLYEDFTSFTWDFVYVRPSLLYGPSSSVGRARYHQLVDVDTVTVQLTAQRYSSFGLFLTLTC